MRRRTTLAVGVLLLAACTASQDDAADVGSSTTSPSNTTSTTATPTTAPATTQPAPPTTQATTTTPPTTASAPASTTTTSPDAPTDRFAVVRATLFPAEPLPGSEGASGSGCSPGAGPLPSGIWYGRILAADTASIDFDLACFYFGDIAWEVAAQAGDEAPNDYWIVNDNPTLRTVPLASDAIVWSIPGDLSDLQPLDYATEWPPDWQRAYAECPGEFCGVWLYVNDGAITEIVEQYVP